MLLEMIMTHVSAASNIPVSVKGNILDLFLIFCA